MESGASSNNFAPRGKAKPRSYAGDDTWDSKPPPRWVIDLIRDMSAWQIIFGGNFFELPPSPCWLIWDKKRTGDFADCELAWTNLPKAVRRIEWLWNGMIRKGSDLREHPTQKPLGVIAWAMDQLPADVRQVCDPFMGSGTMGVAALERGWSFIGIERQESYYEAACDRLRETTAKPKLFTEAATAPQQASWDDMWTSPLKATNPKFER